MSNGRYGYIPRTESAYDVLGLDKTKAHEYTDADISRAYRRASVKAHPDKPTGSQRAFDRLQSAYDLIKSAELRQLYAQYGSRMAPGPGDHMRTTMDKAIPLTFGLFGGVAFTTAFIYSFDWNVLSLISILTLGSGTLVSNEAPVMEVLITGAGGMALGGTTSGLLYGAWCVLSSAVSHVLSF